MKNPPIFRWGASLSTRNPRFSSMVPTIDLVKQRSDSFLLSSSNAVFLSPAPESRLINAEYVRSFLNGFCSSQHPPDMFLFYFLQGDSVAKSCDGITRQQILRKTLDPDMVGLTENGCPFNHVSQLSDIPRPVVLFQGLERLRSKTKETMMPGPTKECQQPFSKDRYIFRPLA